MSRLPRYSTFWRNKWLTATAQNLDEMIAALDEAAQRLRDMRDAGIQLEGDGSDDYAYLYTDDPQVAERFGLHLEAFDEELDEGDDELLGNRNGHG